MSVETTAPQKTFAEPAMAKTQAAGNTRLLYIDNIRIVLITLVIVGHMAITYGASYGSWYYSEPGAASSLFIIVTIWLLGIGASFLLGLFFLISGYFTPHPYDRKGPGKFIIDRLIRLGIPLVFYALVINPLITYLAAVQGGYEGSLLEYIPTHMPQLVNASVGPMWFLEALLIFSLCYALGRLWLKPKSGISSDQSPQPLPGNRTIVLFALGLGLVTFLVRIFAPFGWWWEPLHQEPAHFPQYIAFFAVGVIAYRNDWFTRFQSAQARAWRWAALGLSLMFPALAVAAGALRDEFDPAITGGLTGLSLAYCLWEAFIGVALMITVLVWFRDRFDMQGTLLQKMSLAAYAVYVFHPLIIVPLAVWLSSIQIPLELKFLLVTPLAVTLCFLIGYYLRRLPGLRLIL